MSKAPAPLPFECHLKNSNYDFKGQVLQFGNNAMMVNTGKQVLKPNEMLTITFTFPVLQKSVEITAVSYKTYDKFKGKHKVSEVGDHITEFVFKNVTPEFKNLVTQFRAYVQAHNY